MTVKLPEAARQTGTQIGFQQLSHDGTEQDDWMIDNLRVGGKQVGNGYRIFFQGGGVQN